MKRGTNIKLYIFFFISLAFVLSISTFNAYYLRKTSSKMLTSINNAAEAVNDGDWERSLKIITELNGDWNKIKKSWSMIIRHEEIDNISLKMEESINFIKYRDAKFSENALFSLKNLVEHIPDLEKANFENIF